MYFTFRWYGPHDPITLDMIRQIPQVTGIVSSLHKQPLGALWPQADIEIHAALIKDAGFEWSVLESIPLHEDIKLGKPSRDAYIETWCENIRRAASVGISTICYNFMPMIDWMRSDLAQVLPDGSTALAYEQAVIEAIDPRDLDCNLPAWDFDYSREEFDAILTAYQKMDAEDLWENLQYFLERVIPVAEASAMRLAIHPDDPPWPIFGLPRIITSADAIERLCGLVDSPANGVTLCSGSLGPNAENDIPSMIRKFAGRIHFAHVRNIKRTAEQDFHESAHLSSCGSLDVYEIMKAYHDIGYDGPLRPDHGRCIWNDPGLPGYGLYDRALGINYLSGLQEAIARSS